jgi:transcriptional regulator with XRE-family HTH domain
MTNTGNGAGTVGARVGAAREAAGLPNRSEAARKAGIRSAHLCRLERGQRMPSWGTVHRVICALGLGLEHFFPPALVIESADRIRAAGGEAR